MATILAQARFMPSPKATTIYKAIGSEIARQRKKRKWGQQRLADAADLSRASIANIEQGRHRVQLHVLYDLAAALEMEPHDLLPHLARTRAERPLPTDISRKLKSSKEALAVSRLLEVGKEESHEDK